MVEGKDQIICEELIDEMIAEVWYMVIEYHLNLGPRGRNSVSSISIYKNCEFKDWVYRE